MPAIARQRTLPEMPDKIPISIVMIAHNEADNIGAALASAAAFDEIVVFENGSTDSTVEVAQRYPNVKLVQGAFIGYGPTRNAAASHAGNAWIFALDCDERFRPGLVEELRQHPLNDPTIVYSVRRKTWVFGRPMRFGIWGRDHVRRLYNRQHTGYNNNLVHEHIPEENQVDIQLKGFLDHHFIESADDLLSRMNRFTSMQAKNRPRSKAGFLIYLRARWAFWRAYVLHYGFLDGWRGVVDAWYAADNTFYKHMKAHILAQQEKDKHSG